MRIIGGEYRGRIIRMPRSVKVRPTQDRVREALFNVIRERIPESSVLDLYAGSGAFGIEALSRGAHFSVFVDNNTNCVKTIKSNLSLLKDMEKCSEVLKLEAVKAINKFHKEKKKFDIVFLDPPYYKDLARNSLIKIGACDIVSQRGFVVAEHFAKDTVPEGSGSMRLFKQKRYGDTVLSYYHVP